MDFANVNVLKRLFFGMSCLALIVYFGYLNLDFHSFWQSTFTAISQNYTLIQTTKSKEEGDTMKVQIKQLKKKLILFGTDWFDFPHYPFLKEAREMCPKCEFTEDVDQMFELSDAVIFHEVNLNKIPPINRRSKNQIWIWLFLEAPRNYPFEAQRNHIYNNMFNWTMSYRHDSDINLPYGRIIDRKEILQPEYNQNWTLLLSTIPNNMQDIIDTIMRSPTIEEIKNRKMAVSIISNCNTQSKRELVIEELSKYIQVDMYGTCGHLKCAFTKSLVLNGIDCRYEISNKYKFYLSFENALCEDYVTEKLFDVLHTQMIPIVYGGGDYLKIAPINSYINIQDFSNIKQLANYMKYLDSHPEEYLKYFEWRKTYWVENNGFVIAYCQICDKLWRNDNSFKLYKSTRDWWMKRSDFKNSGKPICYNPHINN